MSKRGKALLGILTAVLLLAGCSSNVTIKEMDSETTAGVIDIVVENADGSQLVLKSEREGIAPESSIEEANAASESSAAVETTAEEGITIPIGGTEESESESMEETTQEETTLAETTADEDGFVAIGTVRCISDGARIRETPRGTILGNCSYGDILQVDGERTDNGWVHVKSDVYGVGYIYQDFVQ